MTGAVEMPLTGHYPSSNKRDSVSWGNFNAPQCVYSTLSVPTSVVLKKLCG